MKFWRQFALVLLLSVTGTAADIAVLRNGYTIRHENREEIGDLTRLYISADRSSFVDIATAEVERFEHDDSPPPATAVAPEATPSRNLMSGLRATPKASPQETADAIASASSRYKLDPDFVSSVVSAESGFNSHAVSPKGAQGLMQLMPGTASQLGVDNAFDPVKNTDGGTRYLRMLLERFHFDVAKALAAYNAGPVRVDQHNGVPPYLETRRYVARIINDYNRKKLAQDKSLANKVAANKTATKANSQRMLSASTSAKSKSSHPSNSPANRRSGTVYQAETFHQQ